MAKAEHRHAIWWLAFISFIESSFFPIPPHPVLGLMCLAQPRRAVFFALVCTAASVAGGLFGYLIGALLYDSIGVWVLTNLGLIERFPVAACYLNQYGAEVILIAGATPVPFKLLTVTAGFVAMDLPTFIGASIAGRGLIFMTVGILFRMFGAPIRAFIEKYLTLMACLFVALVLGGFLAVTQLGGGDDGAAVEPCERATLSDLGR